MFAALFRLLALLLFLPLYVLAAPFKPREVQSIGYIDPSTDEWSSTLSGIGPLILLIGERSTKQVLRNIRGIAFAFSLAAAPLGLLSVVTSLIRFCGVQHLRAFIGYELEARTVAGMEVTRVNCGGVSAHLTDGYIVRFMGPDPATKLVAVSLLEGGEERLGASAVRRIREGERFEREKRRLGVPAGVANLEWVLHVVVERINNDVVDALVRILADAAGVSERSEGVKEFREHLKGVDDAKAIGLPERPDTIEANPSSPNVLGRFQTISTISSSNSQPKDGAQISILEKTKTLSTVNEKEDAPFWDFTFMSTFDAVSEFTTSTPVSHTSAAGIGISAFLGILTVHVLALWQNNWIMSIGWILVVVGYFGIVFGVMLSALIINSSCVCIQLDTNSRSKKEKQSQWKDGMVVSAKNTDSMDTTGSAFVSSPVLHQTLEAVWIKGISRHDRLIASGVTVTLVFAFIAHYLGLRAIKWWASIGELSICILAASARSVSNDLQPRFEEVEGLKIDKRCMSTGVIRTQTSRLIDQPSKGLDARAYSFRTLDNPPTAGERVAFQTAKLCLRNKKVTALITKFIGMHVQIIKESQAPLHRAILATFSGGILFKEGLGFPATRCVLGFRSTCSSLAAPTSLLARAIMRQPTWTLTKDLGTDIPLGNVYIFAIQSMLDWWTLSEDRNDMGDLQRNLHWPMFLLNLGFFLDVLRSSESDEEVIAEVDSAHEGDGEGDLKVAEEVCAYLRRWAGE